jgi:hypothetical protein
MSILKKQTKSTTSSNKHAFSLLNNIENKKNHRVLKHTTSKNIRKNRKIYKNYCNVYKEDINKRKTPVLHKSCLINSICRKTKCKDIDIKIRDARLSKFGFNYNSIIKDLTTKCPDTLTKRMKNKCDEKIIRKLHNDNDIEDLYNDLKQCDNTTCSKEKKIFETNIRRHRRMRLKKKEKEQLARGNFLDDIDIDQIKEIPIKKSKLKTKH